MPSKRILAPIDFSADSLRALRYALDLAKRLHAEIHVLHVVDQTFLASTPELSAANPHWAQLLEEQWCAEGARLERVAAALRKRRRRFRTHLERGLPAPTIVATAKRMQVDLIVMGTHGRTGIGHLVMGSVAEKVVRLAPCPVLTVRGVR